MTISSPRPRIAALADKVLTIMDVVLHIGAQRTASTTFQAYLRSNHVALAQQGVGCWGPLRTRRGGMLAGVNPVPGGGSEDEQLDIARARVGTAIDQCAGRGLSHLVVSDENMLGNVRQNLRSQALYPGAAARLARFAYAFDGAVRRVALSVRALDSFWSSSLAFAVGRGHGVPTRAALDQLVAQPRSWRDVISDVAWAFPDAEIQVYAHETHAGRPERRLAGMTDGTIEPPVKDARLWLHRAPDLAELRATLSRRGGDPERLPSGEGRWHPFDDLQVSALRETYDDDRFWLHAGADGKATFIVEDQPDQAGENLPGGATTRGLNHDQQDGRLARAR